MRYGCRPRLHGPEDISRCFAAAVENVLDINIIPCDPHRYGATGLLCHSHMLRAGGDYQTPWTRDAAVNTWNCLRLLEPEVAKNTLWAVCSVDSQGRPIIQPDVQVWDQIVWTVGAWSYYLATGDEGFLTVARGVVDRALEQLGKTRYVERQGLFRGGSFFNDGISGYPLELHTPGLYDSFGPAHKAVEQIMCLSTNCLYAQAYEIQALMAEHFGDGEASAAARDHRRQLQERIEAVFWDPELGRYDYILYPDGRKDRSQEAAGHIFSVLFDVCPKERQRQLLEGLTVSSRGLVSIWPPFPGLYSPEAPGRHNALIWPFLNGMYIRALCRCGLAERAGRELKAMTELYHGTDLCFWEIYSPDTGAPHGGWQLDHIWDSCRDQTWSAACYFGAVVMGIFGIETTREGIVIRPCVPASMSGARLEGMRIRGMELDVLLQGSGAELAELLLDGRETGAVIPWIQGKHTVTAVMR